MQVKSGKTSRQNVMAAIAETMDIPRDILVNEPQLSLSGRSALQITNHAGVEEYTAQTVAVRTAVGLFVITGADLVIDRVTKEELWVRGRIDGMLVRDS